MISNERLGKIQHDLECWQEDYDPQYDAENHQIMSDAANAIRELLALRKAFSVPDYWEIAGQIFATEEEALSYGYRGKPEPLYSKPEA